MKIMFFDLETNGFNFKKDKIIQFCAKIIDDDTLTEIDNINIFSLENPSDFLLESNSSEYFETIKKEGLEYNDFLREIKGFLNKHQDLDAFGGHNIRDFDNKFLKYNLGIKEILWLLKQHDTRIYETLLTDCDKYGNSPTGKIKTTLQASCERHGISFDPNLAHDAFYDVDKSIELYFSQKKQIENKIKNQLDINSMVFDLGE